jgi:hypothetical protein
VRPSRTSSTRDGLVDSVLRRCRDSRVGNLDSDAIQCPSTRLGCDSMPSRESRAGCDSMPVSSTRMRELAPVDSMLQDTESRAGTGTRASPASWTDSDGSSLHGGGCAATPSDPSESVKLASHILAKMRRGRASWQRSSESARPMRDRIRIPGRPSCAAPVRVCWSACACACVCVGSMETERSRRTLWARPQHRASGPGARFV